jgi:GTP-binding protein
MNRPIRNIAIIAHVDHGKTTLVDCLLKQSGTFAAHERLGERIMDSNDILRSADLTQHKPCDRGSLIAVS